MEKFEYKCSKCNGTNVEARFWVNPNDLRDINPDQEIWDEQDCYCNDCEDNILIKYEN